jgi:NAD(P)-dependent dehydrogenase (short-subunit alcohol dehydrogenase family)
MDGEVILITGAATGIGRATAQLFAREGVKVVVSDVNVTDGEETVQMVKSGGGEAIFVKTDVTNEEDIRRAVEKTVGTYGRLDHAFNNAGIYSEELPLHKTELGLWNKVIAVNLTAVFCCLKYEVGYMIENGGGSIVNTASISGLAGQRGETAYCASKHGVIGLTKTAALEYASEGIRINAVAPGTTKTPILWEWIKADEQSANTVKAMIPMNRFGEPDEIAETVFWLCSNRASYVTGQCIVVDGGLRA